MNHYRYQLLSRHWNILFTNFYNIQILALEVKIIISNKDNCFKIIVSSYTLFCLHSFIFINRPTCIAFKNIWVTIQQIEVYSVTLLSNKLYNKNILLCNIVQCIRKCYNNIKSFKMNDITIACLHQYLQCTKRWQC